MNISENHQVLPLNEEDNKWLDTSLQIAKEMVEFFLKVKPENYFEPQLLDKLFIECLNDVEEKRMPANVVVAAVGSAFGQCLIDELGFQWIIYKDEYGSDLALKNPVTNKIAFPISMVHKKIDSQETGFISATIESFKKNE